MRDNSSLTIAS